MFINHNYIQNLLNSAKKLSNQELEILLKKAEHKEQLSHQDIANLLQIDNKDQLEKIYHTAGKVKEQIYGNRVVVFAPLYISNYCVNNCTYCGYRRDNKFSRAKLTQEQIEQEVKILEKMGHKRIALEAGEDPVNCDIDYVLKSIDTIYNTENVNGRIRRINVNIAATTVENYRKLKAKDIGTYILFQETYHKPTYENVHPKSLKGDYDYHLTAFDRAMEADIDDVGGGVLFGLADYKFEVLALMLHNDHLEEKYGVGFHTVSVPRLKKAEGMDLNMFPNMVSDEEFKKLVAIIRLAIPFTGMILSTRESAALRRELLDFGISQISAGSCTGVGGYKESETKKETKQFELADERSPLEILKELVREGYVPSYCTACYREGRTGDRFMRLAKSGQIQNVCHPNALMTLMEFVLDYGDVELLKMSESFINKQVETIKREDVRKLVKNNLAKLVEGARDLYI